jgi:hypothetical protein
VNFKIDKIFILSTVILEPLFCKPGKVLGARNTSHGVHNYSEGALKPSTKTDFR